MANVEMLGIATLSPTYETAALGDSEEEEVIWRSPPQSKFW
jgi:hypothetical protein